MTSIPLPTDNIYKFYALVGVVLCCLVAYAGEYLVLDLVQRRIAVKLLVDKATVENEYLTDLVHSTRDTINSFKKGTTSEDVQKEGKIVVPWTSRELQQEVERSQELIRDSGLKMAEIESLQTQEHLVATNLLIVKILGSILLVIGFWLSVFGFRKWTAIQKKAG